MADRRGARPVVLVGALLVVLAWILFETWLSLVGLALGVILLDLGVQSALVAHQQLIYGLRAEARGRINTLFMTGMFLGGTLGEGGGGCGVGAHPHIVAEQGPDPPTSAAVASEFAPGWGVAYACPSV